jgi:hypothetical protein
MKDNFNYGEQLNFIRINQLSQSSITMSWKLFQVSISMDLSEDLIKWDLFISVASTAGSEESVLISSNVDHVGTFRVDDLEPGIFLFYSIFF